VIPDLPNFLTALRSYPWWQVAIELLIIGVVVYFSLRFLQGTRGARLLKGVAFILITLYLIVRLVGERFDLARIEFLYSKFLLFSYFAIVIVFQPELRRALMRLGETRLFRSDTTELRGQIDVLVEAALYLSRRRCGALIAVERDTPLSANTESGTRLDAELSPELISTIFYPGSPLHDLGMIVRNGRVSHAAVQFPLAEAGDLERELGSRHRAAVGLSQESDAVIVVVSEETGDISVAERGRLIRKLSEEGLRDLLSGMLGVSDESASRPRRFRVSRFFPFFHTARTPRPSGSNSSPRVDSSASVVK
jgi:diadenylate cyclase